MKYRNMEQAIFIERPNRFIAWVDTLRGREICHVKNTGRCKELLIPGATVFVERNENPARKTPLDLITVIKGERMINMDSQAPNKVVEEWLRKNYKEAAVIRPECKYGDSRFDFYMEIGERKIFIEVKGVTLEDEGIASFPDAPTERGVKHIRELIGCLELGYEAWILFVIQMKGIRHLEPNDRTHPQFGEVLRKAHEVGVKVKAYDCVVTKDSLEMDDEIPVVF